MPETAHPAFEKAGFYFGIEIRRVMLTKEFKVNPLDFKNYIDHNTICLVSSSPNYCNGSYDPTEEISKLAENWGIGCHSDCCLGSFVNPFLEELGYK